MSVNINTGALLTAADRIDSLNKQILSDFDDVQAAISKMDQNWDGSGSDSALGAFNKIKSTYVSERHRVVASLPRFMRSQVGESYEQTEVSVSNAAAAFK